MSPLAAPQFPCIPLRRPVSAERGEVMEQHARIPHFCALAGTTPWAGAVLRFPAAGPRRRDGSRRLAGFWHAGTLAARPSQTDSPAAPDVRDHGWMGWSGGRVRPSAVKHATCFAAGMRRFPISRHVRPDGRPTTRSPLTCPPPPSSVIGLHYIHIRHAPFCNCLNPR